MSPIVLLSGTTLLGTALLAGLVALAATVNHRRARSAKDPTKRAQHQEAAEALEVGTAHGPVPGKFVILVFSFFVVTCGLYVSYEKGDPAWLVLPGGQLVIGLLAHAGLGRLQRRIKLHAPGSAGQAEGKPSGEAEPG